MTVVDGTKGWADLGSCRGNPNLWFSGHAVDIERAKSTCMLCPVLAECRHYVLNAPVHEYGTWAGLSEDERAQGRKMPTSPVTVKVHAPSAALCR